MELYSNQVENKLNQTNIDEPQSHNIFLNRFKKKSSSNIQNQIIKQNIFDK